MDKVYEKAGIKPLKIRKIEVYYICIKLMYNYHIILNYFGKFLRPERCIGVETRSILLDVSV
jgi:hypothetical protein